MSLIQKIRDNDGRVTSFISYGSAVPAPDVKSNPLDYCVTWNPRNIVMAGESGAIYMEEGKMKMLPYNQVFSRTWEVEVDGVGAMEAYPNRDSMVYQDLFKLENVNTMVRATLRYPGWGEVWQQIVKLGFQTNF